MTSKILVPIDLADADSWLTALPAAFEQARAIGAEVTVVTVVPQFFAGLDWRYAIRGELEGSEDFDVHRMVEAAEKRLEQIVSEHLPPGMKAATITRHGTIYDEVLDVAEEIGADQIVMLAHRRNVSEHLLGNNADKIIRHAKCAVNVLRSSRSQSDRRLL